jgi:LCP family protein required for cell wall assembly
MLAGALDRVRIFYELHTSRRRSYTPAMAPPARRLAAGILSMLVPGAGQLYLGARRRGLVLVALTALALLCGVVLVGSASSSVDRTLVAAVLAADLVLLALRLFAVLDVWRGGVVGLAAFAVVTAVPHVAAGYVTVRSYDVLESVFADEEPTDVLHAGLFSPQAIPLPDSVPRDAWELALVERLGPGEVAPLEADARVLAGATPARSRPWTTILLLGTDEGPGNWGARTDTIILAALQHGTGRAVALGIPRNLAQVPAGRTGKPFRQPLNALYAAGGATAVKQAVSTLLGMRVDYYALVNLLGFADLVDALGGVEIRVRERLQDEVTRPAWGEPKPRIDVRAGELRRFYGREALAYVRSRKDSSDYTRMARQRCFLSAMADQLDPVSVLRNFGSLARTIETNVHTDIPLNRLPSLVRLASSVEPKQTLTVTFGLDYFFARRKTDRYPVPNLHRIQATARNAILSPGLLERRGTARTAQASC